MNFFKKIAKSVYTFVARNIYKLIVILLGVYLLMWIKRDNIIRLENLEKAVKDSKPLLSACADYKCIPCDPLKTSQECLEEANPRTIDEKNDYRANEKHVHGIFHTISTETTVPREEYIKEIEQLNRSDRILAGAIEEGYVYAIIGFFDKLVSQAQFLNSLASKTKSDEDPLYFLLTLRKPLQVIVDMKTEGQITFYFRRVTIGQEK